MKQVFFRCFIRRDAVETTARDAVCTEVPVLQAVYGDALAVGESFVADRPEVEPTEEFERLAKRYGKDAVLAAYGTQMAAEREIARLFKEGAVLVADQADAADTGAIAALLAGKADDVIEALPELSDADLAAAHAAEQGAAKPRKTVLEAMATELKERAEEDAAAAAAAK